MSFSINVLRFSFPRRCLGSPAQTRQTDPAQTRRRLTQEAIRAFSQAMPDFHPCAKLACTRNAQQDQGEPRHPRRRGVGGMQGGGGCRDSTLSAALFDHVEGACQKSQQTEQSCLYLTVVYIKTNTSRNRSRVHIVTASQVPPAPNLSLPQIVIPKEVLLSRFL